MNALTICGTSIHQDDSGRFSLNDLHRAAGGEKKHGPSYWLSNQQTADLVAELETTGNPVVTTPGRSGGTYVCKELVYAYAMWISPSFHLKVIRAYDQMVSQPVRDPVEVLNDPSAMRGLLLTYSERVLDLEHRVAEQTPKVKALDRIATADGSMCITDAAKHLQVRPKDLFAWLQQREWIFRRQGGTAWLGYQRRVHQGLLEHKVATVYRSDGTEKVTEQVRITPKGLQRLAMELPADLRAA
jgi:phage antirepressor YoqD-like protein